MLLRSIRRSIHMSASANSPLAALLPKTETHADKFLEAHPDYDGRGIKVAVFDTGVDPGAIGLQTTTTGAPKLLDLIDCTGSGDVKLTTIESTKVILNSDASVYEIQGLSGRQLKVPTSWLKSEGTWQLGLKRVYELWPEDLVTRIKNERKERFMQAHHEYEAEAQSAFAKLEAVSKPSEEELENKKDLEARLKALKELQDQYKDKGPLYDCVVFKPAVETELDKTSPAKIPWAVVDTTETGDLSSLKPMHAYSHSQEFGVFCQASLMSYSFNFYDDNHLSINVVSGTHGTHVAGIIAAQYPDNPILNGVAPGAQIVSMKIGDTRLGSMETSQSFMRAMNEAIRLGVDVINISYGEDSHIANDGPLMNFMREKVIRKHKITVVSSAGNNGPGYSTIGAPGGMTSSIISVGAYVSKAMAKAQYALRDEAGDSAYTWSSRGPSIDGDKGVTIFAPGGAITCVPPYALNHSQLMNGTSMSSPNAAGGVALLICGARAQGVAYSPGSIKRALERTVKDIKDEFKTGLMDIPVAFDDLVEGDGVYEDMYFDIKVDSTKRGIVMRQVNEVETAKVFNVEIKPAFDELATQKKFDFEVFANLKASEDWISCTDFAHLNNTGRVIQVKVDPSSLAPGLYVTSIRGENRANGKTLFEIPITIVKPVKTSDQKRIEFEMDFTSGVIERRFVNIPVGIHGCTIRTTSKNVTTNIQMMAAVTQFLPDTRRTWTSSPYVQVLSSSEQAQHPTKTLPLVEGTAEFCFAQFWSSLADQPMKVTVAIDFHGLHPDFGNELFIQGGTGYKQVIVKSEVGVDDFKPEVKLDMLRKHLRPTSATITSLGSRDVLEDSTRLYSMILQYTVKLSHVGEAQVILPMSYTLYENPWYSTFYQIYDEDKNLVYFGSPYPEKKKYEKKTYTIQVELVHPKREVLESMKDEVIIVDSAIEKEVSLTTYESLLKVWGGTAAEYKNAKLGKGQSRSFVISSKAEAPADASYGDFLIGSITLGKKKEIKTPVKYSVPPAPIAKAEKAEKAKTTIELQVEMGSKISNADEKLKFFSDLSKAHPKDLKVLSAHFDNCQADEKEYIANSIIDLIDELALAQHYGVSQISPADQTDAQKDESREMGLQKELLARAYALKITKSADAKLFAEFLKWTDAKSGASLLTQAKAYLLKHSYGRALEKVLEAKKTGDLKKEEKTEGKEVYNKCLEELTWKKWSEKVIEDDIDQNPSEFRGF